MRTIVAQRWYSRQLYGVEETPSGCRILAPAKSDDYAFLRERFSSAALLGQSIALGKNARHFRRILRSPGA
jgi:hypothetical protein